MSLSPVPASALRACLVQAVRSAEALALQLLQRTGQALQQPAPALQDAAGPALLADAWRSLQLHFGALLQGYSLALLETLAQTARESAPQSVSPSSFVSVLEDGLLQAVVPRVELALADLDALASAAQGMAHVHPQSNPLHPRNYARAWGQLMAAARVEPAHAEVWVEIMGPHLGQLLVSEYARAAKSLREWGVVPASYAPPRADAVPCENRLLLSLLQELSSDLRWIKGPRHMASQSPGGAHESAMTSAAAPLSWGEPGPGWRSSSLAMGLETVPHHPTQVAQLFKALDLAGQASPRARTLQRMMEHMAADAQLLPSVQRIVRSLEPALMQLVEQDVRFFEDQGHPARQLLDELTARSLWFASESAPGFASFIRTAASAVGPLAAQPGADAPRFAQVLQQMRDGWEPAGPEDGTPARPGFGAEALETVARQAWLPDSEHIAQAIRRLPSARGVPEDILDFVTGPWAQVIAQAQAMVAAAGSAVSGRDPGGYLSLVPSLLWSVSSQASADIRRLASLAPRLQSRLAEGLKSVGRTEWEIRALAARLTELHQEAFDAGLALAEVAESRPDVLELSVQGGAGGMGGAETMAATPRPAPDAGDWPLGTWVELHSERQQLRTRLTWMSPEQTLFLFTAADGSTQSMTRRMRDKLAAKGQLRCVAA